MAKKILLVCTNSDRAGAPLHVESIVTSLCTSYEFLIILGGKGSVYYSLLQAGHHVISLEHLCSKVSLLNDLVTFFVILRLSRIYKPSVLHLHSTKAGFIGRLVGILNVIPSLYTVHGWGWRGLPPLQACLTFVTEYMLAIFSNAQYIYVASCLRAEAAQYLPISNDRIHIVYNGVKSCKILNAKPRSSQLIMPARVCAAKDHQTLVRAFEICNSFDSLVLCGSGTNHDSFLCCLKRWAPSKFHLIQCLGESDDLPKLLNESSVFALISHFEAFPLSILEAMSVGMPIIATNVGGIPEMIEDRMSGLLVKPASVDHLVNCFHLLSDCDLRRRLSINSRLAFNEKFQHERMISSIDSIYRRFR
jgi:glycosyltransferase involved in cell wall biosynthesis